MGGCEENEVAVTIDGEPIDHISFDDHDGELPKKDDGNTSEQPT
jgi:hypothetical protein